MLEKNFEVFWQGKKVTDYCRLDDTCFHDVLEYETDTLQWGIGTYSGNSWTPGWVQVYEFPNEQDYNNSDTSEISSYILRKEDVPERFYRLFGREEELIFDNSDPYSGFSSFCEEKGIEIDELTDFLDSFIDPQWIKNDIEEEMMAAVSDAISADLACESR